MRELCRSRVAGTPRRGTGALGSGIHHRRTWVSSISQAIVPVEIRSRALAAFHTQAIHGMVIVVLLGRLHEERDALGEVSVLARTLQVECRQLDLTESAASSCRLFEPFEASWEVDLGAQASDREISNLAWRVRAPTSGLEVCSAGSRGGRTK